MKIPKEFEDVFSGVELTENELRALTWITGWESRTVENLRSAIQKVQATALSTLQAENKAMQKQLNEFSEFLCRMTGGLLSKTNYTAQVMATIAEDYQQKACRECNLQAENEKLREMYQKEKAVCHAVQAELEQVKRALAMMWFSYVNKDEEFPHSFELEALEKAESILGPWAECMPKYLRREQE